MVLAIPLPAELEQQMSRIRRGEQRGDAACPCPCGMAAGGGSLGARGNLQDRGIGEHVVQAELAGASTVPILVCHHGWDGWSNNTRGSSHLKRRHARLVCPICLIKPHGMRGPRCGAEPSLPPAPAGLGGRDVLLPLGHRRLGSMAFHGH